MIKGTLVYEGRTFDITIRDTDVPLSLGAADTDLVVRDAGVERRFRQVAWKCAVNVREKVRGKWKPLRFEPFPHYPGFLFDVYLEVLKIIMGDVIARRDPESIVADPNFRIEE